MGRVGAGTVATTFFAFNPSLVAHFIPAACEAASPEDVVTARFSGVPAAWRRLLGEEVLASPEVAEAAGLARTAAEGCTVSGRPLCAAHVRLSGPSVPDQLSTQNSLPSGSAITTQSTSPWPMSMRAAPREPRRSTSAR